MNFRTIYDLNKVLYDNIHKIPKDIDLVVGIPRSGMLLANLIALYLNLPLTDFDSMLNGEVYASGITKKNSDWISDLNEARKILVVEDSSNSGKSLERAKKRLVNTNFENKAIFLVGYVSYNTVNIPDIWLEKVEYPRVFEWNYCYHPELKNMCFDIDGVLCVDPTSEENDDGEKYVNFIRNAPLRIKPGYKIGYLITSRLEKYRDDTEYWLRKNEIEYGELIMMPLNSKEERQNSGTHGTFKGENYKRIKNSFLFIESNAKQAEEISRLSGKMVFCTENQLVYEEGKATKRKNYIKHTINKYNPRMIYRRLKKKIKKGIK